MPAVKHIIKAGAVVADSYRLHSETDTTPNIDDTYIVPLALYLKTLAALKPADTGNHQPLAWGVFLNNDVILEDVVINILDAPLIAIAFPTFLDGRGFSLARLLRERYAYKGELRALGVIRDQLCYLSRCGFTSFSLGETADLHAALHSLNDFSEAYQNAADQPIPLFKRR